MFAWVNSFVSCFFFFYHDWSVHRCKKKKTPITCMCVLHCWTHHWIVDAPFSPRHQSADAWSICSTAGARSLAVNTVQCLAGYHSQVTFISVCAMTVWNQEWWLGERTTTKFSFALSPTSFFLPVQAYDPAVSCLLLVEERCQKIPMTEKITSKFALRNDVTCVHRPWHNLITCIGTALTICKQQQTNKNEEKCKANSADHR